MWRIAYIYYANNFTSLDGVNLLNIYFDVVRENRKRRQ